MFKITRVKREAMFEMQNEHYHPFYEFYYLLSGERKFFLNGKSYNIKSGDIMLIPKREIHRTTFYGEGSEHERIAMCFDDDFIRRLQSSIGLVKFEQCFQHRHLVVPLEKRAELEKLFEKLLAEYKGQDELSDALCELYCEEIIMFMIRCQKHYNVKMDSAVRELGMEDREMETAAQYINQNFRDSITLPQIADKYGMSDSYFSRRFKQVTGFGFKEYLNMVRIRHACELLVSTDWSVTRISEECGYMDSNYFGDAFRKIKHVSPREYRKNHDQFQYEVV